MKLLLTSYAQELGNNFMISAAVAVAVAVAVERQWRWRLGDGLGKRFVE